MSGLSKRVRELVRDDVRDLVPYDPGFSACEVNLSANENAYGMPSSVRQAIRHAARGVAVSRYPDPMANDLRDLVADWYGVDRRNVCVGNGGDELIFNLFLAFGGPGRTVVDCPPSFSVYATYAEVAGSTVVRVPRDPETFDVDVDALLEAAATADVVVVASPNNPTGNLMGRADVARLCAACPGVVMLDEAYVEFSDPSARCDMLLATCDNLVVLHTFSKAFAMAGMRVGYVLAATDVIDAFAAVRQPYTVDVVAQLAAREVVARRDDFRETIAHLRANRDRLAAELSEMDGVRVWPSEGNFLLVRVPVASEVRAWLRDERSILVRDFSSTPGLEDCLRVTVGTEEENARLVEALGVLLKKED